MAAAEAAIANPLLDETSMKGAQGLLISITGGRDLTLFEVDEAATRIREEVDPDANIILGATFDEELEGLIRVSVVATGIDRTAAEVAGRSADFRPVAPKPIVRPSAAVPAQPQPTVSLQPVPQPQPVQQPLQQQNVDHIALAIREAEMERELDIAARAGSPHRHRSRSPTSRKRPSVRRASSSPASLRRRPHRSCGRRSRHRARSRCRRPSSRRCRRSRSSRSPPRSCGSRPSRYACRRSRTFRRS